jgi:hypothetical protein
VTLSAAITAKSVAISGVTATNKVYNGNLAGSLTGTPQIPDVLVDDFGNVSVTGSPVVQFASANVGTGIPITVSGYTLSGLAAANYWPVQPSGLTADITTRPATVTASDRTKPFGSVLTLGPNQTTGFVATGLAPGEKVDKVTLTASAGTATNAPAGTYSIIASDAAALPSIPPNPFRPENYSISYVAGTLQVLDAVVAVSFNDWVSKYPTLTDTNLVADPDGDGMSNLMEYFFGLDPTKSGGTSGPIMTLTNGPSNTVSMTYRRAKGLTNVESAVQTISNLSSTNWGTNGVTEEVTDKGDYEEVKVTVTNPPGATKMFMRLRVSQP